MLPLCIACEGGYCSSDSEGGVSTLPADYDESGNTETFTSDQ